jgi:hypothetical protein
MDIGAQKFLLLYVTLDSYMPNQLYTTWCEFFWPRSKNSMCLYDHVLSEPHLRTDCQAEFVAGISAIDKTAWLV